ncbi:MAG TPA: pilus assembly protein TadG-related protein [Thermaerobacter sp.]
MAGRHPSGEGTGGSQSGSAAVWFLLVLPVLLLAVGLSLDVGRLVVARAHAQAAADFASLAAVQELDLDRLSRGEPWLRAADAERVARTWVADNLRLGLGEMLAGAAETRVAVINAGDDAPRPHPWTGRLLREPTVAVETVVPVRLRFLPGGPRVRVTVRADASVVRASPRPAPP